MGGEFETIAIERKRIGNTNEFDTSMAEIHQNTNRRGGDLKEVYDFIAVPKTQTQRSESPNPNAAAKDGNQKDNAQARVTKRELNPITDRWLRIGWLKSLAKKSYPTLPLGVDNTSMKVNPHDIGSVIAFALTSNIYVEGLAKVQYMNLHETLSRQ